MASDFRAHALEHRRRLLEQLVPSVHRSSLRRTKDPDTVVNAISDQVGVHDYHRVNSVKVAQQLSNVYRLLSNNSQHTKATVLEDMVNNQLAQVAKKDNIPAEEILLLLFSLSRNVLHSEVPPMEHRHVGAESPRSERSSPPSLCSSSSLQDAYRGAWDESDSLSDWDAPDDQNDAHCARPQTPEIVAEWLHDPALLHTANRRKLEHEHGNLQASKMHLRFESMSVPLPSEVLAPKHVMQAPELPLPAFKTHGEHHTQLQPEDLVHKVLSKSGLLAEVSTQQLCFATSSVALQCLEVLLDRAEVMFSSTASNAPWSTILRTCSAPRSPHLRPLAHTRVHTPAALANSVAPFLRAAQQRAAMVAWVSEVSCSAGVGRTAASLPAGLKSDSVLNPTVAAFVIAIGQQLDLVDAAIQELQVVMRQEVEAGIVRGCLMRTFTLAYPTMRRLNLLHASFSRTIQQCLHAGRPPLSKVSPPRPGRPPRHSRTAAKAAEVLPARVSQAAMDSLYNELLQLDQAAGRDGAVQRAISLHLLVSCMRPSVDSMHTMLREGYLIGPQDHLCARMDANVHVHHPEFWAAPVTAETVGGRGIVPACLEACIGDVSAGAKAVAILHAYGKGSREAALQSGASHAMPSFFRLVEEMTNVVKAPDSHPVAAPAAAPARPHKLSDLLRQASQLLADMRREGEGAADAIYAILEVMDSDEYAGESQLALVPALTPPGGFGGGGFLPPGALEIPPAPDDGRHFAPSPLEMVEGKVSPLPGDANPIGLAEKVAWMDTKGHAPGRVLADVGEADASASELTGVPWDGPGPLVPLEPGQAHASGGMTAAPRVSLPPTTVAAQSEFGTVALDAESLRLHQAGMHTTHPKGPHGMDGGADEGGDDEGGFTDSSSDFSYGSSDGSADVDAEERQVLRQARRALQVARKEARQASRKGPQQLRQHRLGGLEVPPPANNAGKPKAAEPVAVIKTTSDWDRIDEKLLASARATEALPCVVVEDPTLNAPSWARHVSRSMQDAEDHIQADAENLRFAETDAGARRMAQMLPGGTVLPAFTPVQGTEAVGDWMTQVFDPRTIRQQRNGHSTKSQLNGSHWQLMHLNMDAPPMEVALQECLQRSLLQKSFFPRKHLASLILGPCDLMAELQQLRSIMLIGSTHMRHWSKLLAAELNLGLKLSKPDDGTIQALQRLEAQLQQILLDSGIMHSDEIISRQLCLIRDASSRGGLRASSDRAAKHRLLSQLAYVRVMYTVRWPLNVVISQDQLKQYQDVLPVFLQCTWAEHSLDEVSQLLRSMPTYLKLPEVMRRAFRPRGDLHGSRFSVATAAQAAAHMRHVLNAFRHTMLQMGMGSAWRQLCRTLEQASARSAADASSVDLEAVTQAHSEYLNAVFRACWLSKDQISQVVGGSLHEMLDTTLLFCIAVKKALQPSRAAVADGDPSQEKYLRRVAAQHCIKCSTLFTNQIHQLVVTLSQCNLKVVSGSEVTWLLEALNRGGFYDDVLR